MNLVIHQAPQSTDAYEAHSTLAHFYLRIGRFHDAEAQIRAMLAADPRASNLRNLESLFALLANYPDLTILRSYPDAVHSETIDGNIYAPVRVNGYAGTYMLDTGINLSIMSESEAARLGLTPHSSTATLSDIGGATSAPLQVVEVDDLIIGRTHLRHVPFLVFADANGAFTGVPPSHCGILGIQPLLALGALGFRTDGTLSIASKVETGTTTEPLLFDGEMPLTQISYRDKPLAVTFDVGATQTTFNPPFAKLYPEILRSGVNESHTLNGLSGATEKQSISLPHLSLNFGREVTLAPATILLDQTGGSSAWAAANLGYDLMQQAEPFTIDFRKMRIEFGASQ
ncbi:MAG TPA: retropepsin-like aspartic protease [Silvibacterium sp.]|nr:retropepsin-like aspartic protease [Silvibacterium sp.]